MKGKGLRWAVFIVMAGTSCVACAEREPCVDLAEVCAGCPDTPDGRLARASCEDTVASEDATACEDRLDRDRYVPFGCPRF
ncbi:MAG: hypothetical protein AAF715_28410 [Myxococcota bacterium]